MRTIPLSNSDLEAYVDDEDYERVIKIKWYLHEKGKKLYVKSTAYVFGKYMSLHEFVLGFKENFEIDHIDNDGLNNCKSNLRHVTRSVNLQGRKSKENGSSSFLGVDYRENRGSWRARIGVDGSTVHIGLFKTELEAAHAYDKVARNIYGDDARTNF